MEKRLWIGLGMPQMDKAVQVSLNKAKNLWVVKQEKKIVIYCSHLILKNVVFHHELGAVSGLISSKEEIDDIRTRMDGDLNSVFAHSIVEYENGEFTKNNKIINFCPYLDMVSLDDPMMLAIYPGYFVWGK